VLNQLEESPKYDSSITQLITSSRRINSCITKFRDDTVFFHLTSSALSMF